MKNTLTILILICMLLTLVSSAFLDSEGTIVPELVTGILAGILGILTFIRNRFYEE